MMFALNLRVVKTLKLIPFLNAVNIQCMVEMDLEDIHLHIIMKVHTF